MKRCGHRSSHLLQGLALLRTNLKTPCRWAVYVIRHKDFPHVRFVLLETLMAPFCLIVAGVMEYA